MENTSRYLHRAAIGYFIASIGLLSFGFPFWFLNAIDKMPKGRFFPLSFIWSMTCQAFGSPTGLS
ncbi:hypothetical protein [Spirosoma foliorum]|uniref:hypothetical protein n=1 Tax=Spirosoma foliorum TaxID=2710596 RepID=UPI001F0ABA50|nr:hypothetical protein [Spirosoma foliorum]